MTNEQKKIVVVDDNNAILTACKKILKPHYEVYPVPSAAKMFDLLEHVMPDLILLDVDMEDVNGYEAAGKLKESEAFKEIPIIFLSGRVDATSEMFGLNLGALDYIHKPFVSELLIRRIETNLSLIKQRNNVAEIRAPLEAVIDTLSAARDTDDHGKLKDCLDIALAALKQLREHIGKTPKIEE